MLENSFQPDKRLQDNPLGSHLQKLATSLAKDGYADDTVGSKLGLRADFGWWFGRTGFATASLDERLVEAFVKHRRQVRRGDSKTLEQFLEHLRKRAVIPDRQTARDMSPLTDILSRYGRHLRSERGLATATVLNYQPFIRKFLVERFRKGPFLFREVKPSDISNSVLRHAHRMAVGRAQLMTTAFRSFLHFLFPHGELQVNLAASVPTVADWRPSIVPKYLAPEEVERVLKACDRGTVTGRRDYAILLLLARLGLRLSAKGHGRGPRLHDMRHRFAACALIRWYRAGLDGEGELPKLATDLGHVHVNDTYWYLEAVPELLHLATDRLIEREVRP